MLASPACLPSAGNSHAPRLRAASTAVSLLHVISECVCVCEGERKREGEAEKEGWQVVVCLVALL